MLIINTYIKWFKFNDIAFKTAQKIMQVENVDNKTEKEL